LSESVVEVLDEVAEVAAGAALLAGFGAFFAEKAINFR